MPGFDQLPTEGSEILKNELAHKAILFSLVFWVTGCVTPAEPEWSIYRLELGKASFEMMVPSGLTGDLAPFERQLASISLTGARFSSSNGRVTILEKFNHSYDGIWSSKGKSAASISVTVVRKKPDETYDPRNPAEIYRHMVVQAEKNNSTP